jgi:hypothetical protein
MWVFITIKELLQTILACITSIVMHTTVIEVAVHLFLYSIFCFLVCSYQLSFQGIVTKALRIRNSKARLKYMSEACKGHTECLEDDCPGDGAKVGWKPVGIGNISNPEDNTILAKWVGPRSSWKCTTLTGLPLGLLAELDSPAALLEVPSPKGLSAPPIISLEHCMIKKQFE